MTATRHWVIVWLCNGVDSSAGCRGALHWPKGAPAATLNLIQKLLQHFRSPSQDHDRVVLSANKYQRILNRKLTTHWNACCVFFLSFSLLFHSGQQRPKHCCLLLSNRLCFALSLLLAVSLRHTLNKAAVQRQLTHAGILHSLPMGMWLGAEGRGRILSDFSKATEQEKQYGFSAASRCSWAYCRLG